MTQIKLLLRSLPVGFGLLVSFPGSLLAQAESGQLESGDPFYRKQSGEGASERADPAQSIKQLTMLVEHILVPDTKLDPWLQEHTLSEAAEFRTAALDWIAAGQGTYLDALLVTTGPGQRTQVRAAQDLIYPAEWIEPDYDKALAVPVAFETRRVGSVLELDPEPSADGSQVKVDISSSVVRYLGEGTLGGRPVGGEQSTDVVADPRFGDINVRTSVTLDLGESAVIGKRIAEGEPGYTVVTLLSADTVLRKDNADIEIPERVQLEGEWVAVPTEFWVRATTEAGGLSGVMTDFYPSVTQALEEGTANLLSRDLIVTQLGQRAKASGTEEVVYAVEYDVPESLVDAPVANAFETMRTGSSLEVQLGLPKGESTLASLNMAAGQTSQVGESVHYRYRTGDQVDAWETGIKMPRFFEMHCTTQIKIEMGDSVLVAVASPPGEDGFIDPTRKALFFVHFRP